MAARKKIYKSEALESVHVSATGLHEIGAISDEKMRQFDRSCLVDGAGASELDQKPDSTENQS